jgi:1-acyl-sn-glycerol-3-phosphate acyltransferase
MEDWKHEPARDHGLTHRESFSSLKREDGLPSLACHAAWWSLVRAYLAVAHRLEIIGRTNLPAKRPFVLVANHSSHLDVMVMASMLPMRLRAVALPVAAGDTFFSSPRKSAFSALALNALPLWRKSGGVHAIQELRRRALSDPCIMVIFPEGTRTRTGEMAQFKPGIGMIVAGTSAPIVPCYLKGCFESMPPDRGFPRFGKVSVRIGEPLTFEGVANGREGWFEIARRVEQAVVRLRELS